MSLWKPIDAAADWLRHSFGVQAQLRTGVIMVGIGIVLHVLGFISAFGLPPFAGEPQGVFHMSALAIVFAGVGVVVTAETLKEVASEEDG